MCGIVGAITPGTMPVQYKSWFKQALLCDSLRGMDSTGVITVAPHTNQVNTYKKAVNSHDFLDMRKAASVLDNVAWLQVGHNRAATMGVVNNANAHPFSVGTITLVHNGTLKDFYKVQGFAVDSEYIAHLISTHGVQHMVDTVTGAYALVWHDSADNTVHFLRNEERPLYVGHADDGFVFGSEQGMVTWLAERNNIKLKEVVSLKEHTEWVVSTDGQTLSGKAIKRTPAEKPKQQALVYQSPVSDTVATKLSRLGLKQNPLVRWLKWTPYTTGGEGRRRFGLMEGHLFDKEYSVVEFRGITEEDASKFLHHDCYATIGGAVDKITDKGHSNIFLVYNKDTIHTLASKPVREYDAKALPHGHFVYSSSNNYLKYCGDKCTNCDTKLTTKNIPGGELWTDGMFLCCDCVAEIDKSGVLA